MRKSKTEPARDGDRIRILLSSAHYADQMEALTGIVYDVDPRQCERELHADHFRQHMRVFPEGQFIAVDTATDTVIGLSVTMRCNYEPGRPWREPWWVAIGSGWLTTHAPDGEWLYGVESCVHPDYRGQGIGRRLMDARFDLARRLNLHGMAAGSAIIDYHTAAHEVSVEQYVREVVAGQRFDTNLSKQIHMGFQVRGLIANYLIGDETTLGWAVLIVWNNPAYRPARRPRWSALPRHYTLRRRNRPMPVFR